MRTVDNDFKDGDSNTPHQALLLALSLVVIGLLGQSVWTPLFVTSLLTVDYLTLACATARPALRRVLLWANWTLLPLGFFALQLSGYIGVLGDSAFFAPMHAAWLLGLPFYILSMLSINHEIQAGKMARPPWLDFMLFGAYFPKFLSGPVEHPALLQQLRRFRFRYRPEAFANGCDWLILGAFCKFIVAYYLSRNVYGPQAQTAGEILQSVMAFELQVYFDLAGYSFMAYGISAMLGLELTLNFKHPFFSGNIQSFWQRWHISLGRWFHTYVHTPMRQRAPDSLVAVLGLPVLVFLLSAAWHGQTLNYLVWGLWHGLAYLVYVRFLKGRPWPLWLGLPALLLVLLFGRFLFMESNFHFLVQKLERLFTAQAWAQSWAALQALQFDIGLRAHYDLLVAVVLSAGFLLAEYRNQRLALPAYGIFRRPSAQWLMIAIGLMLLEGSPKGFIYARQ